LTAASANSSRDILLKFLPTFFITLVERVGGGGLNHTPDNFSYHIVPA
jgi:hypothetical protein